MGASLEMAQSVFSQGLLQVKQETRNLLLLPKITFLSIEIMGMERVVEFMQVFRRLPHIDLPYNLMGSRGRRKIRKEREGSEIVWL